MGKLKNILDYIFYRSTRLYKNWGESHPEVSGQIVVVACSVWIILGILNIVSAVSGIILSSSQYNATVIIITLLISVICLVVFNSSRYAILDSKWRDEKHKQLKGWLIFIFVLICLALLFITMSFVP